MNFDKVINVLQYILGMSFNLAIVVVVGYAVYHFAFVGFEFGENTANDMVAVGPDYEVEFILDEDTSASEVARRLEEMGVINNSLLFQAELFLLGRTSEFEAGTFNLNRNMTNSDIRRVLRTRPQELAPHEVVRVIEGWNMRDMAMYFEYREFFTAEEFFYVAENGHFRFPFLIDVPERENRLEGYLFPETYHVSLNPTPGEIINIMLRQFDRVFDDSMYVQAEELGMSVDDIIIIASIIEREVRVPSEMAVVSQVIHSRLAMNMRLEMCSTVIYVLDVPRRRLSFADTQTPSPFNTYLHAGLPPGSISSPSEAAIRAALWPADTDYLFFVLMDETTGEHHFSRTYAEHAEATERYLD